MNTSAIITYRKVFQSAKMHQGETALFAKEQLIPFEAALVDYSKQLTDEQQKQGLFAEGFDAFQMTRAGVVNQTIQKAQARLTTADPAISALIDRVQLAQRNVESARVALSLEQALPDIERSAEVERNLENRLQANQKEFDTTNQQLSMQFPAYSKLTNPQPLALLDVRNSLGDHEAIVSFMLGRKQSFVQLTKRSGNYITKMDVSEADLFDVVKSLRNALEVRGGSIHEFDLQKSNALFETIFGGLREPLQDVTHLLVAPSGPLASLPFGLLVTEPAKSEDYSQAKWLIQKMAISQVPSIQAFYTLRTSAHHTKPAKSLLAFADPVLEGPTQHTIEFQCKTAGPMNSAVLRALAPLPDTASEVQTVANVLGRDKSTLMFKEQATEQSFRAQKLSDYRVIYFATHGLLPGELRCQSEPGLVLTPPKQQATQTSADGLLAASEIAGMKLNADMVVLSACNTAGSGGKFGGDALSGLAESFFFAGARSLVASHWQVPSSATASLLSNMFIQLGPQLQGGAAPALRAAQMQMLSQKPQSHPFFWAAFVVLGDGMATGSTQ